ELAQGAEVARLEEALESAAGQFASVDFALAEARGELFGRQVDQLDLVGIFENLIGDRFTNADAGDAGNDVVQAFEMLDVERGVDVDAGFDQLCDILPALRVTALGRIGVGIFVDDQELWFAREGGVDVEFGECVAVISNLLAGDDLETFEQRLGLLAAVRF